MATTKRVESRALYEAEADATLKSKAPQHSELLPGSSLYPPQLLQLQDMPKRLYAVGNVKALTQPAIAIVGARKATPYGLECAERFAAIAAQMGVTVVSGGAIGCDMAAHRGALKAGGETVVVLGSGADVVYPLRAKTLFKEVLEHGGVLVSEAPWGSAPLAWAFSKRNRIIAALGKATLICEAGLPSGTFQTADHTLSLGNEVLVIPGPILSKEFKGSNRLLAQGAIPIVDDDYFRETIEQLFGWGYSSQGTLPCTRALDLSSVERPEQTPAVKEDERDDTNDNDETLSVAPVESTSESPEVSDAGIQSGEQAPHEIKERRLSEFLIAAIEANPMTIDALAEARGESVVRVVQSITKLEISGQVERLRDGRYMIRRKAAHGLLR